jgi:branched-chain amino acid aminotransferase
MPKYAFFNGNIVPIENAKVSVMNHAFNYGTGCFEGIRAYWNTDEDQLFVFRLLEHFRRLHRSCKILHIHLPYSPEELCGLLLELLRREEYREDTYIRPLAYKATEAIGVRLHDLEDAFTMFALPFGRYIEGDLGARVMISPWRRIDDNAIPARAKITGSYINSALSKTAAAMAGCDEAIVLTQAGHVAEGSAENLFLVRDGRLVTPPATDDILEGITRDTVMEIARAEFGVESDIRSVDRSELYVADEAFFCGTGVQIEPIVEIDNRTIGDGKMGPITQKLYDLYFDIVRGKVQKYRRWCTPVY